MPRQLFHFLIAGAIGFGIDAGVLWLSLAAGQGYFIGRGLSFFAAVWTTWRINRRYTFQSEGVRHGSVWREWWQYLLAMSLGGTVNYAVYSLVIVSFPASRLLPFEGVALGSIAGMALNFAAPSGGYSSVPRIRNTRMSACPPIEKSVRAPFP